MNNDVKFIKPNQLFLLIPMLIHSHKIRTDLLVEETVMTRGKPDADTTINGIPVKTKQEAHGPNFPHLSKSAIDYLQMPCNILPALPH